MNLDEKELKKHLKGNEVYPCYLFYGDEDYLRKLYCDKLKRKIVSEDFESFNFDKFSGKNCTLKDVFERADVMPMMSDKRLVFLEDYKLEGLTKDDEVLMENYFSSLPDSSVIIFYESNSDFSISKAKKAADIIGKYGAVCALNKRKGAELTKPLISSAQKQGCVLSAQMANYLVSVVGDDFNVLINELSKVCNYCKEGEIKREHIDAVGIKTDDAKIYYLTKALFQKNFDKAYEALHSLLNQKIESEYILGVIVSSFVDLYRAKVSLLSSKKSDELSADFGYKNTAFRLTNAGRDASYMPVSAIRKSLEILSEGDMKLKSSRDNPVIILEQLLVQLFLVLGGEKV